MADGQEKRTQTGEVLVGLIHALAARVAAGEITVEEAWHEVYKCASADD